MLAPMAEGLLVVKLVGLTQGLHVMLLACRVHGRPPAAARTHPLVANAAKIKQTENQTVACETRES